ncbi:hypothetical protein JRI60_35550 [Archangium violaceum]|nr:hypothetical protein [Archangium violaceum]QRN94421.1 hypothetical protein JRI60_35550 [Archangium violaceum]
MANSAPWVSAVVYPAAVATDANGSLIVTGSFSGRRVSPGVFRAVSV